MPPDSQFLLRDLLRDVSRSFYLTLRVLPSSVRDQIGLAYLLARTTDTIADTTLIPVDSRLIKLEQLRNRILGTDSTPLDFSGVADQQGSRPERLLLQNCEVAIGALDSMPSADAARVRKVLEIISSGQQLDLQRFSAASPSNIIALSTAAELDDYTFRVAGCVGEFWTRMCQEHVFRKWTAPANFLENGIRFGKGLQLVNILRDVPADLKQGRCYLPRAELNELGLTPAELLEPTAESRVRPLYEEYLAQAENHLQAGWSYTVSIPARYMRVRLACAWPALLGAETLRLLKTGRFLQSTNRIKVSRQRVKVLMLKSVLLYPIQPRWRLLFQIEQ